jgi:hypothetical protein
MKCPVTIAISSFLQKDKVLSAINMAIVGTDAVNEYNSEGVLVPKKFPEDQTEALRNAHYAVSRSRSIEIEFDVTIEGEFVNFRAAKT